MVGVRVGRHIRDFQHWGAWDALREQPIGQLESVEAGERLGEHGLECCAVELA